MFEIQNFDKTKTIRTIKKWDNGYLVMDVDYDTL